MEGVVEQWARTFAATEVWLRLSPKWYQIHCVTFVVKVNKHGGKIVLCSLVWYCRYKLNRLKSTIGNVCWVLVIYRQTLLIVCGRGW